MSGKNAPAENDGTHPSFKVNDYLHFLTMNPSLVEEADGIYSMEPEWWGVWLDFQYRFPERFESWWAKRTDPAERRIASLLRIKLGTVDER